MSEPVIGADAGDPQQQNDSGDPKPNTSLTLEQVLARNAELEKALKAANAEAKERRLAAKGKDKNGGDAEPATTELEQMKRDLAELRANYEAVQKQAAREAAINKVLAETGLSPALAKFLQGDDFETLVANAKDLMAALPQASPNNKNRVSTGNNADESRLTKEALAKMSQKEVTALMMKNPDAVNKALSDS